VRRANRDAIVPITGTARGSARNRVTTSETQLAGFALDDRCRFGGLFVRWNGGFPCLATGTEFVKAKGTRAEVSTLIETTLVAYDFSRIERGPAPGRRLGGVAVKATATKVLSLLAGGVVGQLDGDGGTGGRREIRRVVVVGLEGGSKVELLRGDDEGGVLELDRLGVMAVGERVRVNGEVVVVLGLGDVVANVGKGSAAGDGMVVQGVLLLVMPLGVVGRVVDVYIVGCVVVVRVMFVKLLEERVWV